ncbi:hypothetical protein Pla108_01320 [Botrimarina colliarenosi]|uniref:Uncharacterized protein n=2 Tax=Botrimarina colliarenosi TaxID=2528001 RepID=A0A5C6AI92_9BACT|nr:hypothetical protein Pla108_01320 [Botrimarina colliarenosi]
MHRLLSLTLGVAIGCGQNPPPPSVPTATPAVVETSVVKTPAVEKPGDGFIPDDGKTLWASPTRGGPIDPSLCPEGSGLFLHLRPAALLSSAEGRRVWKALGPAADLGVLLEESGPLAAIKTLTVGVGPGASYESVTTTVAIDPEPTDRLPLLPREIEQLLETTDRDQHVTLIFSPRFLLGDGGSLLAGPWAPLRELLLAQARDEWAAVAISLHLDEAERLYWELRVLANVAEPETRTAAAVLQRAEGWSSDLAAVVKSRNWASYSAAVVERSPRMLAVVGDYARRGVDGRQAVVNGYAPPGAAHQLALAAERIVAELAAPPVITPASTTAPSLAAIPIAERLQTPVTIQFRRESLETAVAILSDTLATAIEIRGRDLQLEGITRNQMIALDVMEKPAVEALVDVLRKANPDPLATGPADPRQKLVYVVTDDGVAITTRAAAARHGDELPTVFQSE